MSDRIKIILAMFCFLAALVLPIVSLIIGWWRWDVKAGILLMAAGFLMPLIAGGLILLRVNDLSWLVVILPYIFGGIYTVLPDAIPFVSADDAVATLIGAFLSYALALQKQPDTRKRIFLPLLTAGIYTFFGGVIPGTFDEAFIDITALVLTFIGSWYERKRPPEIETKTLP
ncbi:MAG: hypothetical protein IZT55_02790 [Anaerolineae bacterium]|nr:hypothetical protein [Anaerolineae bacterium]